MNLPACRSKIKPRKASSKTAEAERINTFLPEIVASFKPDSPLKAQADGSTRVGNKGALVLGPEAGLWYDHEASVGGRTAHTLLKHLGDLQGEFTSVDAQRIVDRQHQFETDGAPLGYPVRLGGEGNDANQIQGKEAPDQAAAAVNTDRHALFTRSVLVGVAAGR